MQLFHLYSHTDTLSAPGHEVKYITASVFLNVKNSTPVLLKKSSYCPISIVYLHSYINVRDSDVFKPPRMMNNVLATTSNIICRNSVYIKAFIQPWHFKNFRIL